MFVCAPPSDACVRFSIYCILRLTKKPGGGGRRVTMKRVLDTIHLLFDLSSQKMGHNGNSGNSVLDGLAVYLHVDRLYVGAEYGCTADIFQPTSIRWLTVLFVYIVSKQLLFLSK